MLQKEVFMVTRVGQQRNFLDGVKELIELDYDAIEAYKAAIENLENPDFQEKLTGFKNDHISHTRELSDFLKRNNETPPNGPDNTKNLLATGKVEVASLLGDKNILQAMLSNELDTNVAYERMYARANESADGKIESILKKGLSDEQRHKKWLEDRINELKK